ALSFYGAHALYLDSLLGGAQRDRLWVGPLNAPDLGFAAILVTAGLYGLRRVITCRNANGPSDRWPRTASPSPRPRLHSSAPSPPSIRKSSRGPNPRPLR